RISKSVKGGCVRPWTISECVPGIVTRRQTAVKRLPMESTRPAKGAPTTVGWSIKRGCDAQQAQEIWLMTDADAALRNIRTLARGGQMRVTPHAHAEMIADQITLDNALNAI